MRQRPQKPSEVLPTSSVVMAFQARGTAHLLSVGYSNSLLPRFLRSHSSYAAALRKSACGAGRAPWAD